MKWGLKGVYKPDFVAPLIRWGSRSFLWADRFRSAQATHPRGRGPRNPLSVLLQVGFAERSGFPARWW